MKSKFIYDFSAGVDKTLSKLAMSLKTKKLNWAESYNVEPYNSTGVTRMDGNEVLFSLPSGVNVLGMSEYIKGDDVHIVLTADDGKFYFYDTYSHVLSAKKTGLSTSAKPLFASFLDGVIVINGVDEAFYFKSGESVEVVDCNIVDSSAQTVVPVAVAVFNGRIWVADKNTLYFSALGLYDDWTTAEDAGYIANFHNDTGSIVAISTYRSYLAIYKEDGTYLLSGSKPDEYVITQYADKGSVSPSGLVTVENKQYFFNRGVYTLEEVGELNQIFVSSNKGEPILSELEKVDRTKFSAISCVEYSTKNQIRFYLPIQGEQGLNVCWVYDFSLKIWFKRVIPFEVKAVCEFDGKILIADASANVLVEDRGNTFNQCNIEFLWRSPYIALGEPNKRKSVDEFWLVLDDFKDNNFEMYLCKDYDDTVQDDCISVNTTGGYTLVWAGDDDADDVNLWADDEGGPKWLKYFETNELAPLSNANKSVQVNISGDKPEENFALIGIEFRDILDEE